MTKRQIKQEIIGLVLCITGILFLGATIFHFIEGWSYIDAFYFVTMTATTVGYGDFTPTHNLSKIITIIYALSIIPFVLYSFSFIAKSQVDKVSQKVHHIERKQQEQEVELNVTEKKLKKQKETLKDQEKEILEHDQELEVVEEIMEEELKKQ